MKTHKFISRFSPNRTDPEDLEKIHVQRHALLDEAVDLVRESARTKNKHHLLFVGARGCGKTHLLALIKHRLGKQSDLGNRLRIAWLNEDETSTSFLDLLVRIYQALAARYPAEFPSEDVEKLFGNDPDKAREAIGGSLIGHAGKHTILVVIENLDGIFRQFEEAEQRSWRSFIQNHPIFATVATAQSLFAGVREQDQPFYGFFDTRHLLPLSADEATELLQKIAVLNGDVDLEAFLKTPRGRARIRAIHHLSHGNHRLYVVLSELISAESLDALVQPFETMVDEQLTPYYQERLRWLSPLQRKIVELLCQRGQPSPVKDIADRLFAAHSTITPQLKNLREMGYVVSTPRGRESLYELAEPLMRLSMQVKDTPQSEPLGVIVDFLRVWYERDELEDRLANTGPTERIRDYLRAALAGKSNLRHELLRSDLEGVDPKECDDQQFEQMRVLAEETNAAADWKKYGLACRWRKEYTNAVEAFTQAMKETPADIHSLLGRADSLLHLRRNEEGIADCTRIIDLPGAPEDDVAIARVYRSNFSLKSHRWSDAIGDASILVDSSDPHAIYFGLLVRAESFMQSGQFEAAINDCFRIMDLPGVIDSDIAWGKTILSQTSDGVVADSIRAFGSSEIWPTQVKEVVKIFAAHGALNYLGDALVRHLSKLATTPISGEGLKQWSAHWKSSADEHEAMRLPLRLLRVGIDYLSSQPMDEGVLLQLPAEERVLLRQVLSLPA
jgi:DNA-binding transcriptional ArsR family regulator